MKTVIVGLDAFDPEVFERLHEKGSLPNLGHLVEAGGYRRFSVANPAQSEVSWTSIATGLNPGGHGLFDFVHRNPANYALSVSLLPTKTGRVGTQFVPPHQARTLFDQAAEDGYPATVLWWPATFPARLESPVRTLPGLGVPDVLGRIGVGVYFSTEPGSEPGVRKTQLETLYPAGKGAFTGVLRGPQRKKGGSTADSRLEIGLETREDGSALLRVGGQSVDLAPGAWSPILTLPFKIGLFFKVRAITRVILLQGKTSPRLYFLPLQIHPLHSPWRYGTPPRFVRKTWESGGPFLTLGWPQDTTALEEGIITDDQFLALCEDIFAVRERIFLAQLDDFREGVLANVFDTLDRVQHMFWRDRPDVIENWYRKLDGMVGKVRERLESPERAGARLLVVSDHGFNLFDRKVHLNRRLLDRGYLVSQNSPERGGLGTADWAKTSAYAIGLNSLYLNLEGREGQGAVPKSGAQETASKIRRDLLEWEDGSGQNVFREVWTREEAFQGELSPFGPDLVLGYAPGFRASAETGLGNWEGAAIQPNRDHWGADHCVHPEAVPGTLFFNGSLAGYEHPSYRDFPSLALGRPFEPQSSVSPPGDLGADGPEVEERLKGLGYL